MSVNSKILDKNTSHIKTLGGFPCLLPNKTFNDCFSHYISYNSHDTGLYGGVTTAIVLKCWYWSVEHRKNIHYGDVFLILLGKHDALLGMDLLDCLNYFSKNIDLKARYSDDLSDYLNYVPLHIKLGIS